MNIGLCIKQYRKLNKLTQEEFAKRVGVSKQCVSKWESDKANPKMDMIYKLSKIMGISVSDMISSGEKESEVFAGECRRRYIVGLNCLYENVHDFKTFCNFAVSFSAAYDVCVGEPLLHGSINVDDEKSQPTSKDLYLIHVNKKDNAVVLVTEDEKMWFLKENEFTIKPIACYDNESYLFELVIDKIQVPVTLILRLKGAD